MRVVESASGTGGLAGEGLRWSWNGVGGRQILGCKLGGSLPIRRIVQLLSKILHETKFPFGGDHRSVKRGGGIAQLR